MLVDVRKRKKTAEMGNLRQQQQRLVAIALDRTALGTRQASDVGSVLSWLGRRVMTRQRLSLVFVGSSVKCVCAAVRSRSMRTSDTPLHIPCSRIQSRGGRLAANIVS